jgi:hypothetical protein
VVRGVGETEHPGAGEGIALRMVALLDYQSIWRSKLCMARPSS